MPEELSIDLDKLAGLERRALSFKGPKARARLNNNVLRLYGIVGDPWEGFTDESVAELLDGLEEGSDLRVRVNSPGGLISQGMAVYSILKDMNPTFVVDGWAASMASIIIMAGHVKVHKGSMIMIHNPWLFSIGDSSDLRKDADILDKLKQTLVAIYSEKTGLDSEELVSMMDEETWLTAEEAVSKGFADELIQKKTSQEPANLSAHSAARNMPKRLRLKLEGNSKSVKTAPNGGNTMTRKTPSAGPALASLLNDAIDEIDESDGDDRSRSDVISEMASEADIAEGTVNQILNADIDCPPLARLEGFARVDGIPSVSSQRSAAEEDGCEFGDGNGSTACAVKANAKQLSRARAQSAKAERERISSILSCDEAANRPKMASHLALKTGTSAEDAKGLLAASAEERQAAADPLGTAMSGQSPGISSDDGGAAESEQDETQAAATFILNAGKAGTN